MRFSAEGARENGNGVAVYPRKLTRAFSACSCRIPIPRASPQAFLNLGFAANEPPYLPHLQDQI
jgi:hypothetical protein